VHTHYSATALKDKLISLDTLRESLSATEPISTVGFPTGESVKFRVQPAWNHEVEKKQGSDALDVSVRVGQQEFQLTRDALFEATSLMGMPKGYAQKCPAKLLEPQLNYWYQGGLGQKDLKLITSAGRAAAITKASLAAFSNIELLDRALQGIYAQYGEGVEVLADYKFEHSLKRTRFRLIVPDHVRRIASARDSDDAPDNWSMGLQVKNSITGVDKTAVQGYLFAWWCTNGAIDTFADSGEWSRRSGGQSEEEVYAWAREAVDDVLGGLEHSLDKVQSLTDIEVEGEASDVLRDVFEQYRIPTSERRAIIDNMVNSTSLTMYDVMQAVTAAANGQDMTPAHAELLMQVGGDLPHAAHQRCDSCHRLTTH
jgi:hypothetical protein